MARAARRTAKVVAFRRGPAKPRSRKAVRPARFWGALKRNTGLLALAIVAVTGYQQFFESPVTAALPGFGNKTVQDGAASGKTISAHFPLCGSGGRVTCIIDGDTLWLSGEKLRIADIDTPEVFSPACPSEYTQGMAATHRLQALLNAGPFELRDNPGRAEDRYGRRLATVHRDGRSLGAVLVAEGLAERWGGPRVAWCA